MEIEIFVIKDGEFMLMNKQINSLSLVRNHLIDLPLQNTRLAKVHTLFH